MRRTGGRGKSRLKKFKKINEKMKKVVDFCFWICYYTKCAADKAVSCGSLAQLAEHLTLNQGVQGSNP